MQHHSDIVTKIDWRGERIRGHSTPGIEKLGTFGDLQITELIHVLRTYSFAVLTGSPQTVLGGYLNCEVMRATLEHLEGAFRAFLSALPTSDAAFEATHEIHSHVIQDLQAHIPDYRDI